MARMQPAEFSREEDGVRAPVIGTSVPRKEGRAKVTGSALYVDDLVFPDMLFGATVRSAVARGRLCVIPFENSIPRAEFTIVPRGKGRRGRRRERRRFRGRRRIRNGRARATLHRAARNDPASKPV